jgi:hypothetical protein
MGARLGVLRVSSHLLVQALGLPENTLIQAVHIPIDEPNVLEFRVEEESLPLVKEGAVIQRVKASLERVAIDGQAYEVRFVGWVG